MMGSRLRVVVVGVLALGVAACNGSNTESTTTTGSELESTTTVPPPATTTTTELDPCTDVFCVVYHIRPEAAWSDGTEVTAADFVFTYETVIDPVNGLPDAGGYDLITDAVILDEKTVLFAFSQSYGPWQSLFPVVLPSHVMSEGFVQGLAYSTTAGPFVLGDLPETGGVVLVRNPVYWSDTDPISGEPLGDVKELRFVPSQSIRDSFAQLETGALDYMNPRPLDWMVAEAEDIESATHDLGGGPFWEHIDFNHDDPLLSQYWVREAISMAIDRHALADETLRKIDPDGALLGNTFWMTDSVDYEAHFDDGFDPEAAEQILIDHSCQLGDDGVYSCQARRMSFTWATTVGDQDREMVFEMVSDWLEGIGIEVVPLFMSPSRLFSTDVFFGGPDVWQIMNFSWKAEADPYLANSTYFCEGSAPSGFGLLNINRYCNSDVERLVRSTNQLVDREERVATYNEADRLYLDDLAIIPLYQKPAFAVWDAELTGPRLNPSRSTDLWNVGAWSGKESVVVAVDGEPRLGNPVLPPDDEVAIVLAAMLSGAYGVNPDLQFVPVLVEGADLIVAGD